MLGEATKVALLRKRVPLTYGVPALVVDNLLYNLSVLLCFDRRLRDVVCIPVAAANSLCAYRNRCSCSPGNRDRGLGSERRILLMTWIIDRLAQLRLSPKVILKRRQHIYHLESKVYDFYKHHPKTFFGMIGCNLVAHLSSVVEVYVTLRMLGFNPLLSQAYIIESLTKVINVTFAFVPGTIGVYEAALKLFCRRLVLRKRLGGPCSRT